MVLEEGRIKDDDDDVAGGLQPGHLSRPLQAKKKNTLKTTQRESSINAPPRTNTNNTHHQNSLYYKLPNKREITFKMSSDMASQISQGALRFVIKFKNLAIFSNLKNSAIFNDNDGIREKYPVPVCQCVRISPLAPQGNNAPERYRIVLSDVKNFVQCMLATRIITPICTSLNIH